SANQNDRRSCHLHPPVSSALHPRGNEGEFMAKCERRCEAMTFLQSASARGAVSAYAQRHSSRLQRYAMVSRTKAKIADRNPMSNVNPNPFTTRPEIEGTFGVVTSTHWIATAAGMSVLEKGGNAFDAACAPAFTLQVVEPHLNGPGGDVPAVLFDVRKGHAEVICGQGPAPAGATIAHYRSLGLDMMPGTGL